MLEEKDVQTQTQVKGNKRSTCPFVTISACLKFFLTSIPTNQLNFLSFWE